MTPYYAIALITVTIRISSHHPTPQNPDNYGHDLCTGVFISQDEVLTANHCFEDGRNHQWIKTYDNISYPATIELQDKNKDLALLKIPNIKHSYAYLAKNVYKSEHVYTVNSGDEWDGTYSEGIVDNFIHDPDNNSWSILHSAPILPGASGSGLFNSHNELIGINVATIGRFSEAVDLSEVKQFLRT